MNGSLQITSVVENRTTFNIVADSKSGDKNNVVVIGAHSDSVEAGPGINDDGSGTIGILVTAMQLSKYNYRLKNALRVCFWSAEGEDFFPGILLRVHTNVFQNRIRPIGQQILRRLPLRGRA